MFARDWESDGTFISIPPRQGLGNAFVSFLFFLFFLLFELGTGQWESPLDTDRSWAHGRGRVSEDGDLIRSRPRVRSSVLSLPFHEEILHATTCFRVIE